MMDKLLTMTKNVNLDVYKNPLYINNLNEYNLHSYENIELIKELLKNDYFIVPSYTKKTEWGDEIIYYPFTNKLFKVINTYINDTSIQVHPLKCEKWYPLKESNIFDGYKWIPVNKTKIVDIKRNSIHCMKKNGKVFEIQDNNLFDKRETIRIYDVNNRPIDTSQNILNNTMPNNKNNVLIIDNNLKLESLYDILLYIIDGNAYINNKKIKSNTLYYIKNKLISNIRINGIFAYEEANYYIREKKI